VAWTSPFGSRKERITFTELRMPSQEAADLRLITGLIDAASWASAIRAIVNRRSTRGSLPASGRHEHHAARQRKCIG
jgi:hypothetical protein